MHISIRNKLNKDSNEPVNSQTEWLEYILPNCTKIELQSINLERITTTSGVYTDSRNIHVYEYLVWFHDQLMPVTKRLASKTEVKEIAS